MIKTYSMTDWIQAYSPESIIGKARDFASLAHEGILRASKEPYVTHCIKTAESVYQWGLDDATIAAALLHDTVEDTGITIEDIAKEFGEEIAFLVQGVTKLAKVSYEGNDHDNVQAENMRKMVLAFCEDLRVVFIKLADRLHNMQTLQFLAPPDQKRISLETAEIYAPLAYRLGMQKLSGELEDLSFPYLYPKEYEWLLGAVKEQFEERQAYAERVKPIVEKKLNEHNIKPLAIDCRAKRYSSLYKKLLRWNMDIEKIYDLVALRIVVSDVAQCYTALGIIHQFWPPLSGKIKDYIARPKPNGYRSLHTTVFCIDNKITEFQIRTQEMHEEAELGIAAHWAYQQIKDNAEQKKRWHGVADKKELAWVQQLRNWQQTFGEQKGFLEALKADFFKDRIFVITPKNDVIDLPAGATPVDFAYSIHSEIGNQCVGAKVNHKIVPLNYKLNSGDLVEIMTQKGKKPSESWLEFAATSMAKQHIKSVLRSKNKIIQEKAKQAPSLDFRITAQTRPGLLKDITNAFHQSRVSIESLHTANGPKLSVPLVLVTCPILEQQKIEKLLVKLKQITGVKEIGYKFNR